MLLRARLIDGLVTAELYRGQSVTVLCPAAIAPVFPRSGAWLAPVPPGVAACLSRALAALVPCGTGWQASLPAWLATVTVSARAGVPTVDALAHFAAHLPPGVDPPSLAALSRALSASGVQRWTSDHRRGYVLNLGLWPSSRPAPRRTEAVIADWLARRVTPIPRRPGGGVTTDALIRAYGRTVTRTAMGRAAASLGFRSYLGSREGSRVRVWCVTFGAQEAE